MSHDNRSIMNKVKDELVPSLFAAGVGVLGASFVLGVDLSQSINVFGMSLPAWAAIGSTIAVADIIAYASHDYVLEKIPMIQNSGIASYENRLLAPVLSGGATYLLLREGVSTDVSLLNSILLGGGSTILGKYVYDTYENAKMQNWANNIIK